MATKRPRSPSTSSDGGGDPAPKRARRASSPQELPRAAAVARELHALYALRGLTHLNFELIGEVAEAVRPPPPTAADLAAGVWALAAAGDAKGVHRLCAADPALATKRRDVGRVCGNAETPLHVAAASGHAAVVRVLVDEFGAPADGMNHEGYTPMALALLEGHLEVARVLAAADPTTLYRCTWWGNPALHVAAREGHEAAVRMLVAEFGADVRRRDADENTAVDAALGRGHIGVARVLVRELGGSATPRGTHAPALTLAAQSKGAEVARAIVREFGADVDAQDYLGHTALSYAALSGNFRFARALLEELGADPTIADRDGVLPRAHTRVGGETRELLEAATDAWVPRAPS